MVNLFNIRYVIGNLVSWLGDNLWYPEYYFEQK